MSEEKAGTPEDFAALFGRTPPPEDARDTGEPDFRADDEENPNGQGFINLLTGVDNTKQEKQAILLRQIHGPEPEVSGGFDGGAHGRAIAPPSTPPTETEVDHAHGLWLRDTFPHRKSLG